MIREPFWFQLPTRYSAVTIFQGRLAQHVEICSSEEVEFEENAIKRPELPVAVRSK